MKTVALLRRCPLLIGMTLLIFFFSQRTYQLQQRRAGVVVHGFFSPSITTIGPKRRCVYTDRNYLHTTSPMIISKINKQGRVLRIASSCLRRSRLFSSWHSFSAINSNSYDSTDRLPRSTLFSTIQSASSPFRATMTSYSPFMRSSTKLVAGSITSKFRCRYFPSNIPSLHSTVSSTATEDDSNNTNTTATVTIQKKRQQSIVFADQTSESTVPPSNTAARPEEVTTIRNNENFDLPEEIIESTINGLEGLKSTPVEGGNWTPKTSLDWTKDFGKRCSEYEERCQTSFTRLGPGDDEYFDVSDIDDALRNNVTIVRTKDQARIVMEKLMKADPSIFHACDTEVMDINLKVVGPIGNGYVTCLSVYSGPEFDYGLGSSIGSTLWIDNIDDAHGILQEFKPWMEDERFKKIWHNYGFDRHVMWNEGIDCRGFGGDTMHMARLQDTSRLKNGGGYSLEALTGELLNMRKKPMKEIFGVPRIKKDGTPGSLVDIPPIDVLQRNPKFRTDFIMYSCYDAVGTWKLHQRLVSLLEKMHWMEGNNLYYYYTHNMREFGEVLTDMERRGVRVDADNYLASVEVQARKDRKEHLRTFRRWAASQIGVDGLALNPASSVQLCTFLFGGSINTKTKEPIESVRVFKVAREDVPEDAMEAYRKRSEKKNEQNTSKDEIESNQLDVMTAVQLKALCKEYGLKVSGKKAVIKERVIEYLLSNPMNDIIGDEFDQMTDDDLRQSCTARTLDGSGDRSELLNRLRDDIKFMNEIEAAIPPDSSAHQMIIDALETAASRGGVTEEILSSLKEKSLIEPKHVDVKIQSIGMDALKYTAGGAPSVTADVLRKLAGEPFEEPPKYGLAYEFFGGKESGHKACVALYSLCAIGSIDTMIANFLTSLQSLADHQSRVHCSLNLNTETGRLSSRRPNLQNQPALEKDKYKIRQAFQASPGNSLIVADYGQLELRLLASMTRCASMIDAFESGGDFHSRTAIDMFDYVKQKVDDGEVLLEWDYSKGDPPKPLLKDKFASERRKAKTLNFSIAYGKTSHGLSQDWGVTKEEAQEMLNKWYEARPEVLEWQANTKAYARKFGITRTLMGRYRQLPEATGSNRRFIGHAERASINTPIQGGAADVAMMAMIKINKSEKLKRLGWILLLQIHDEVVLEGPEETAEEAFEEVIQCMEAPWVEGLQKTAVPLLVDGSWKHKNWYDAK